MQGREHVLGKSFFAEFILQLGCWINPLSEFSQCIPCSNRLIPFWRIIQEIEMILQHLNPQCPQPTFEWKTTSQNGAKNTNLTKNKLPGIWCIVGVVIYIIRNVIPLLGRSCSCCNWLWARRVQESCNKNNSCLKASP